MEIIISFVIGWIASMTAFFHFERTDEKSKYKLSFLWYLPFWMLHTFFALVIVYFLFVKGN